MKIANFDDLCTDLDYTIGELHKLILNWDNTEFEYGVCGLTGFSDIPYYIRWLIVDMWVQEFGNPLSSRTYPIAGSSEYSISQDDGTMGKNMNRLHFAIWLRHTCINLLCMLKNDSIIHEHYTSYCGIGDRMELWMDKSVQYYKQTYKGKESMRVHPYLCEGKPKLRSEGKILIGLNWVPFEYVVYNGFIAEIQCQGMKFAFNTVTGVTGYQGDHSLAKRNLVDHFCSASAKFKA